MINSNKIKGKIVESGFTQADIAKKMGLAQATVNQKINNVRPIDLNEAEKLAEILGISKEEFALYFFT